MLTHSTYKWGAAILVSIGAGLFALYRGGVIGSRLSDAEAERNLEISTSLERGRDLYKPLSVKPIDSLPEASDTLAFVRDRLEIEHGELAAHTGASHDSIITESMEMLRRRFLENAPHSYLEWRQSLGYVSPDRAKLMRGGVPEEYQAIAGEPMSDAPEFEDVFRVFWNFANSFKTGLNKPVAFSGDAKSFVLSFGELKSLDGAMPEIEASRGTEFWNGHSRGALRLWQRPPVDFPEILARDGKVLIARFGMMIEYQSGDRRPFVFTHFYNPVDKRWWLRWVSTHSIDPNSPISSLEL